MKKVIGNDINIVIRIQQTYNGLTTFVNLNDMNSIEVTIKQYYAKYKCEDYEIDADGKMIIPLLAKHQTLGGLSLEITYQDEINKQYRYSSDNIITFVSKTSDADSTPLPYDIELDSVDVIAEIISGLKGEPFTYEDFTEEQLNSFREPAESAANQVLATEAKILVAESDRENNEHNRVDNEQSRVDNEELRNEDEELRKASEVQRNDVFQEQMLASQTATKEAKEAATNANEIANSIPTLIENKLDKEQRVNYTNIVIKLK